MIRDESKKKVHLTTYIFGHNICNCDFIHEVINIEHCKDKLLVNACDK